MDLSTMCMTVMCISCVALLLSLLVAALFHKKEISKTEASLVKRRALLTPFQVFLIGFFMATAVLFYPVYFVDYFSAEEGFVRVFQSVLLSIHNTMRLFILDGDFDIIKNTVGDLTRVSASLSVVYSVYFSVFFVLAPVLSAGFVLSFFKEASASLKYLVIPKADIYVMSALNERSIALAEDIIINNDSKRRRVVLFADVFEKEEEEHSDLVTRAKRLGAICFRKDITSIGLKPLQRGILRKLYFISDREDENLKQALVLITRCRGEKHYNTQNTHFYVFANTVESEVLLNSIENGNMRVRRVRQTHNLALQTLRKYPIFDHFVETPTSKVMNIVIVGLGGYGTELLKALCWCGQMIGYTLNIHIFDSMDDGAAKLKNIAPELIAYNHKRIKGEPFYNLYFHNKIDVTSSAFLEKIAKIEQITMTYVTLGDDELNVATAMKIRMQFGRDAVDFGRKLPPIFAVLYSSLKSDTIAHNGGLKSLDNIDYGICFIGSMRERYSLDFIEREALEEEGLECHLKWATTAEKKAESAQLYEKHEYYRRSSISEAVHAACRKNLGLIAGVSDEIDRQIGECEHKRWNAFMRAEGYVGRNSPKDDVAKVHPDLVPCEQLDDSEFEKDLAVIS